MAQSSVIVLLNNLRSLYNVGSILRTADATGVTTVVCCGYTPYPAIADDPRPKFEAARTTKAIAKTALGAEKSVECVHFDTATEAINHFRERGYQIVAIEQAENSQNLFKYKPTGPLVLLLGPEVEGHDQNILDEVDTILEIPMAGSKESLNVSVVAGVALYQINR